MMIFLWIVVLWIEEILYITKIKNIEAMAKPIRETPVLTGEDALKFELASQNVSPASNEEKEEAKRAYEFFQSVARFAL